MSRRIRRWIGFFLSSYAVFCLGAGVFVAEMTLHPQRRPLPETRAALLPISQLVGGDLHDVSITASDGIVLRAWSIRPSQPNGDAVILLHGLSDNRLGMIGYARLLLAQGYSILMPDARAHGASDGTLVTYGMIERGDIHRWFQWVEDNEPSHCIFGFGESMGAAELLQALQAEPRFCAVAAESPFANFYEIAYDRVGQYFQTGPWLGRTVLRPLVEVAFFYARRKYGLDLAQVSPEDVVAASEVPVFLIHGKDDHNIPIRHSRSIKAHKPSVKLWEVPGTDHCGSISTHPDEFRNLLLDWFDSHRSRT